jgi:hypothetical protein
MRHFVPELLRRIRLALIVLLWGDLKDGNLKHLKALGAELEFIVTHQDDLSKDEIMSLITGGIDKTETGILHHVNHILTSLQNWRIVNAEMREAELIDLRRKIAKLLKRDK